MPQRAFSISVPATVPVEPVLVAETPVVVVTVQPIPVVNARRGT